MDSYPKPPPPESASCPFCGADYSHLRVMWSHPEPNREHYYVACFECMAAGPHCATMAVAITKWNTAFAVFLDKAR